MVTAVVGAGFVDEAADCGEGGGEVQVELDGAAVLLGAAAVLGVAVHPGVGVLHDPAFAGLDGAGMGLRAISWT